MLGRLRRLLGGGFSTEVREEEWPYHPTGEASLTIGLDVAVHPARSERVVGVLPGWNGTLNGYADKYAKLAEHLRASSGVAVVRSENRITAGHAFETTCQAKLRALVQGIQREAPRICGQADPEVWLLGYSASASAAAAVAAEFPRVSKLLLIAPSSDAGLDEVRSGLQRFAGSVAIVVGADDEVVGDLPQSLAAELPESRLVVVPNCDHQFRGAANGRILSQAPGWGFVGDPAFPDPSGGVHLYD